MAQAASLNIQLTPEEMDYVRRRLGREPNALEWSMIDAEWSEHCSYKSSKPLLKLLPTEGEKVLLGPGFDAGIIDVGDGYVVSVHIESHNHPSAVDPYGGAATGIGGVLRDILCIGSRPIALLDPLRFGRIDRSHHSQWLFKNVVRGIADYGNCVGVPTIAGEVQFDESFERNCLVDVACVGLGRREGIVLAEARNPRDLIILAGGSTGRDGIRGVTFASRKLEADADKDRSSVQVPDPFVKKMIIEATLEAITTGAVPGLKDLGGGGLTTGLSETVAKGGCGALVDISRMILREVDMAPEEIMISESQERMLFVVKSGREREVFDIFRKYGVSYSAIGEVTADSNLVVRRGDEVLASLPAALVAEAPVIRREAMKPSYLEELRQMAPPQSPRPEPREALIEMLASPNICSREWIYRQYDHEVGVKTVVKPGQADAGLLRLPNGRFLAVKSDGNSRHAYLDPYNGGAGCVAEAARNVVAVGARPVAMVDHLQFGDPSKPEIFWTFSESVRGMAEYCRTLGIPCVGGKVSFYNEDSLTGKAIKPSPVAVVLGLLDEYRKIPSMGLRSEGDVVIMVGESRNELGGSEYYEHVLGFTGGVAPAVRPESDVITFKTMLSLISQGWLESCHDLSKGGLAVGLAETCMAGGIGADVEVAGIPGPSTSLEARLYSETHGRFLAGVKEDLLEKVGERLSGSGTPWAVLGRAGGDRLRFKDQDRDVIDIPLSVVKGAWTSALPWMMGEFA